MLPTFVRITDVAVELGTFQSGRRRQEHCLVTKELRTALNLAIGDQIRVNFTASSGTAFPGVFTLIGEIPDRTGNVVQIFANTGTSGSDGGVFRLFQTTGSSATIPAGSAVVWNMAASDVRVDGSQITDHPPTRAEPSATGRFVERATTGDADHRIVLLVAHGGGIDDKTSRQIQPFTDALAGAASPSVWECEGQWSAGGTSKRWHITAGDIRAPAFPGLFELNNERTPYQTGFPFEYAYALHGYDQTGGNFGIVIGGRAPSEDKRVVLHQIRLALGQLRGDVKLCIAHNSVPPGQTSQYEKLFETATNAWGTSFDFGDFDGLLPANIVNRVARFGIQLEQARELRQNNLNEHRDRIARGLGHAASRLKNKVYMRDNTADIGVPRSAGTICFSPDVTVQRQPFDLGDPQSPIFDKAAVLPSNTVEAGSLHHVYVRAYNRGENPASGFRAHLWFAPPATLALPSTWNPVGTLDLPALPCAPAGDTSPTVGTFLWIPPAGTIGHRSMVCVLDDTGTPLDEIQQAAAGWSIEDFREFIRGENRAVWHNSNLVDDVSSEIQGGGLPFAVPAAPGEDREFALDVEGNVPDGWQVQIAIPLELEERLEAGRSEEITRSQEDNGALLSLPGSGTWQLGAGVLPGDSVSDCRLFIQQCSGGFPEGEHTVRVRQLFEGEPLGAITWRIA